MWNSFGGPGTRERFSLLQEQPIYMRVVQYMLQTRGNIWDSPSARLLDAVVS